MKISRVTQSQVTYYTCDIDVINSIVFSHHVGGPLASDHENLIKNFGMTSSTLGRGHGLMEPSGPVWVSISPSYLSLLVFNTKISLLQLPIFIPILLWVLLTARVKPPIR